MGVNKQALGLSGNQDRTETCFYLVDGGTNIVLELVWELKSPQG